LIVNEKMSENESGIRRLQSQSLYGWKESIGMVLQNFLPLVRGQALEAAQTLLPIFRGDKFNRELQGSKDPDNESVIVSEFKT